ncbi:MAG: hypothetical protein AB8B96_07805 [Lysobacterales bacterium]
MRPILNRWQLALLVITAALSGPALADQNGHSKHFDARVGVYPNSQVRTYPAHYGHSNRRHNRRHDRHNNRPFQHRNYRRNFNQYRYYPRSNGYSVYERPVYQRRYYGGNSGHHDHYHRNRPLLRIVQNIDRYVHCESHGGYFLREDLHYH